MDKRAAAPCMVACPAGCAGGTANSSAPVIYVAGQRKQLKHLHTLTYIYRHSVGNASPITEPGPAVFARNARISVRTNERFEFEREFWQSAYYRIDKQLRGP